MANEFRQCTKSELEQFVQNYPRPLKVDVFAGGDPPLRSYNDFSEGRVWPVSVVAKVVLGSVRDGEEDLYYISEEG